MGWCLMKNLFLIVLVLCFIPSALADSDMFYVGTGNDDWHVHSETGADYDDALLYVAANNMFIPNIDSIGYADINTSGIPDNSTVSSATLYWDEDSYPATRNTGKTYKVWIEGPEGYELLSEFTFTSASVRSYELTEQQESYINKNGKTHFRWTVSDPGSLKSRAFYLKSYETSQSNAPRLNITYGSYQEINEKDSSKFVDDQAFLISDEDWRDVLSLVPVSTWTDESGAVTKYPVLTYHSENDTSFDIDSVIHFMQLYAPSEVILVNDISQDVLDVLGSDSGTSQSVIQQDPNSYFGPGLNSSQLVNLSSDDYISYWDNYESLVIVDYDGYEEGLMGSVYASYYNMPILFLDNSNLNASKSYIDGKDIFVIGDLDSSVSEYINDSAVLKEEFTKDELLFEYIGLVNPEDIILVNSVDVLNYTSKEFPTDKSDSNVSELFGMHSIASSFLAAGDHRIILDVADANVSWAPMDYGCSNDNLVFFYSQSFLVDEFIKDSYYNLFGNLTPNSLFIISSPRGIIDSIFSSCYDEDESEAKRDAKDAFYGLDPNNLFVSSSSPSPLFSGPISVSDDYSYILVKNTTSVSSPGMEMRYYQIDKNSDNITLDNISFDLGDHSRTISEFDFVVDNDENMHILVSDYNDTFDQVNYFKINGSNGETIFGPKIVSRESIDLSSNHIAVDLDSNDDFHVVWTDKYNSTDSLYRVFYSKFNGTTGGALINSTLVSSLTSTTWAKNPKIDIDYSGDAHIAWHENQLYTGKYNSIFYSKLNGSGGEIIIDSYLFDFTTYLPSNKLESPEIVVDTEKNVFVSWIRQEASTREILYSKFNESMLLEINRSLVSNEGYYASEHGTYDLDIDSEDNLHFVWSDEYYGFEVVYSKFNGSDGSSIIENEIVFDDNSVSYNPQLVNDGNDNFLFWADAFEGPFFNFYSKLNNVNGTALNLVKIHPFDYFVMPTGRAYGMTISDVSSYLMRDLYYADIMEEIHGEEYFGLSIASDLQFGLPGDDDTIHNAQYLKNITSLGRYNASCYTCGTDYYNCTENNNYMNGCSVATGPAPANFDEYRKLHFLTFADHGWRGGWMETLSSYPWHDNYLPLFDLTYSFGMACSTGNFWQDHEQFTFAPTLLRRGVMSYFGAVGIAEYNSIKNCELGAIKRQTSNNMSAGLLNIKLWHDHDCGRFDGITSYADRFILYGDPSLVPDLKNIDWS